MARAAPDSLAVDGTHVYWGNSEDGTIKKVPIGGGSVTTLATTVGGGDGGIYSLAVGP